MNLTDLGNAERLIERYGKEIRYCHAWGKFFVWDGKRWCVDEDGRAERRAKETVRAIYAYASTLPDDKRAVVAAWALKSESAARIAAMLDLAKSEPGVPIAPNHFDSNPWTFNCLDGEVDIRTLEVQAHQSAHYITRLMPWHLDTTATCPAWQEHLKLVMGGDTDLIAFLKRAYGSCLTGSVADRKLFIQWGIGRNGKSICNEAVALILGDYATRTATDTLLVKRGEQIPNDLARLKGMRFVFASETERGRRLSESLVKDLTGGERIIARFLHQEFFEFHPTFKLWLSTNNRPEIRGSDDAIWDRICLIPYTVRIPESIEKKPYQVLGAFREEADGILGWLAEGAYEWYHKGLQPPARVTAAVANYRDEMDDLVSFFEENCLFERGQKVTASAIYNRYTMWAEENDEKKPLSKKALASELHARGGYPAKSGSTRLWHGVGLKSKLLHAVEKGHGTQGTLKT